MSTPWPSVRLNEVLKAVSRPESVQVGKTYRVLGAHWYACGLFVKDICDGAAIRADKVYRVELGDFVYNRLFAWKGSFAVVDAAVDGCYVSNEFPCFRPELERLDPRFLHRYMSRESAWATALGLSSGGTPTSRNRLKEESFLGMAIPLPALAEQQRIMARVDALAVRIAEANSLRHQAVDEAVSLCRSIVTSDKKSTLTPMRELVRLRQPDVIVRPADSYQFAGVYSFGRGVFRTGCKSGLEFAYPRLTRLRAGDFVYPKLMAWEGAFGVVPPDCDGCVVSTEFPVFEIDDSRVLPEVLDTYFRMPSVWPAIAGFSTGTNVRRRRLNPRDFLAYRLPLPSRETQERLRRVNLQVEALKRLQAETAAELEALMPAILDRAFKGEL